MIFYVYLDPKVLTIARQNEPFGMQALIGILYGFLQNCFIADFEDGRGWNELGEIIDTLEEVDDRKRIQAILKAMYNRNRFIGCLSPDYAGGKSDLECLVEQAPAMLLDLLLLSEIGKDLEGFTDAETATLNTYQHTYFASDRAKLACDGVTLEEGELDELVFLNKFLKKALMYAREIEICDKMFGDRYGGNYKYTAQVFFKWLEQSLANPDECKIMIHCGVPDDDTWLDAMKEHLMSLKRGRLGRIIFKLCLYDIVSKKGALPHDRFIVTDQLAFGLPRGMDFLNQQTKKNRDLTLDYKSSSQVNKLITSYAEGRRPEIDL